MYVTAWTTRPLRSSAAISIWRYPRPGTPSVEVKAQQVASRDPVKYAPNLGVGVRVQICRCGLAPGSAIEIEAKPVALDAAGTTLERLYAATSAKGAVVHIGSIGEIPHLLPWSAAKASTSIAIIAARQEPGLPGEPAQLEPKSSSCLAHRQLRYPTTWGWGKSGKSGYRVGEATARNNPRPSAAPGPEVGKGPAIFSGAAPGRLGFSR